MESGNLHFSFASQTSSKQYRSLLGPHPYDLGRGIQRNNKYGYYPMHNSRPSFGRGNLGSGAHVRGRGNSYQRNNKYGYYPMHNSRPSFGRGNLGSGAYHPGHGYAYQRNNTYGYYPMHNSRPLVARGNLGPGSYRRSNVAFQLHAQQCSTTPSAPKDTSGSCQTKINKGEQKQTDEDSKSQEKHISPQAEVIDKDHTFGRSDIPTIPPATTTTQETDGPADEDYERLPGPSETSVDFVVENDREATANYRFYQSSREDRYKGFSFSGSPPYDYGDLPGNQELVDKAADLTPIETSVSVSHFGRSDLPATTFTTTEEQQPDVVETTETTDLVHSENFDDKAAGSKNTGLAAHIDHPSTEAYHGPLATTSRITDINTIPIETSVSVCHSGQYDTLPTVPSTATVEESVTEHDEMRQNLMPTDGQHQQEHISADQDKEKEATKRKSYEENRAAALKKYKVTPEEFQEELDRMENGEPEVGKRGRRIEKKLDPMAIAKRVDMRKKRKEEKEKKEKN